MIEEMAADIEKIYNKREVQVSAIKRKSNFQEGKLMVQFIMHEGKGENSL